MVEERFRPQNQRIVWSVAVHDVVARAATDRPTASSKRNTRRLPMNVATPLFLSFGPLQLHPPASANNPTKSTKPLTAGLRIEVSASSFNSPITSTSTSSKCSISSVRQFRTHRLHNNNYHHHHHDNKANDDNNNGNNERNFFTKENSNGSNGSQTNVAFGMGPVRTIRQEEGCCDV